MLKQDMTAKNTKTKAKTKAGPKVFKGTVVKTAMRDTATVVVKRYVQHPKYKKYIERSKKFLVHDVGNTAKVGDVVLIRSTRPISKNKHFELLETVVPAVAAE